MIEDVELAPEGGKWSPPWARVISYVAVSLYVGLALFQVWIILDDLSYRGDKFDGLAAFFASILLGFLVVPFTTTVLFLKFGGKWKFTFSAILLGLIVLAPVAYIFSLK